MPTSKLIQEIIRSAAIVQDASFDAVFAGFGTRKQAALSGKARYYFGRAMRLRARLGEDFTIVSPAARMACSNSLVS